MRTPSCKHFDFAYETFEGERLIYCARHGARVKPCQCSRCKDRERKDPGNDVVPTTPSDTRERPF